MNRGVAYPHRLQGAKLLLEDEQWAEQIRNGDHEAFEALFLAYHSELVRFALIHVRSSEVAEDIVQNLFFHIWQGRTEWKPRGSLRAYLFGAVRNESLKILRHERVIDRWRAGFIPRTDTSTPEDDIRYQQLIEAARKAVEGLPERRKLIFKLSRHQEMTYAEIAAVLGLSIKTVENQMVRALEYMRGRLAPLIRDLP